ncbi:hypothetical protein ACFPN0_21985 [Kitasatospora cinereorecta]
MNASGAAADGSRPATVVCGLGLDVRGPGTQRPRIVVRPGAGAAEQPGAAFPGVPARRESPGAGQLAGTATAPGYPGPALTVERHPHHQLVAQEQRSFLAGSFGA